MTYKATLDNTSKTITILITVLFIGISIYQAWLFQMHGKWPPVFIILLLIIIYLIAYLYHPVGYEVQNNHITIHRPASNITFPRSDIRNAISLPDGKLKGTFRTFGVGGLFGYFGQFMNSELGSMTWYATQRKGVCILIELNSGKKYILTPDDPEAFLQNITTAG